MKVLRLHLRNWRGVEDREVRFAPAGVTVVEGPNEAGKSSLIEALDLLFDEMDSSGKARVRAVKPVHADLGAEVEADVETGPYAFTYAKRFHKKAQTTLAVRTPAAESLTGRDAHARAEEILRETLDVSLWRALRVAQGDGLDQADLREKPWLAAALDRAAGSAGTPQSGTREQSLHDEVRAEKERWWTERGPRKELADAERAAADAAAEVERLRGEIAKVEADVERAASLAREIVRLGAAAAELSRRLSEHDDRTREADRLAAGVAAAEKRAAEADAVLVRAQARADERRKLAEAAARAESAAIDAGRERDTEAPGLGLARAALDEAERAFAAAHESADLAQRDHDLRERDFEFRRDELDLVQMDERRLRVEEADRSAAEAEAVIARVRVTDAALTKLRRLHEDVVKAQVRLDAASASVRVSALGPATPVVDGSPVALAAGESRDFRVAGTWRLEVPGQVAVEVRSGAGTDEPRSQHDDCRRALADGLAGFGADDLPAAERANAALREAKRTVSESERAAKDALRDLSRETLARKVASLRPRVAAYLAERPDTPALAADFDAAQDLRRAAKDAAAAAREAVESARRRLDEARTRHDALAGRVRDLDVRLALQRETAARQRREVETVRAVDPDESLAAALATARDAHAVVAGDAALARAALAAAEPDVVRSLAAAARAAAAAAARDQRAREDELLAVRARLDTLGEAGLSEKLGAAESLAASWSRRHARMRAQADAAKALFDEFERERNAERARYVAPFREKVEALGRVVFGADFSVAVDDDLRIASRTLGGRTVEFESLSGGAREQIGVVARLACAILAAGEGGVPVVLDDSFGWSDPDRLERMGALLAHAGRTCQVILLTCDPARARGVPGATVVRIA